MNSLCTAAGAAAISYPLVALGLTALFADKITGESHLMGATIKSDVLWATFANSPAFQIIDVAAIALSVYGLIYSNRKMKEAVKERGGLEKAIAKPDERKIKAKPTAVLEGELFELDSKDPRYSGRTTVYKPILDKKKNTENVPISFWKRYFAKRTA